MGESDERKKARRRRMEELPALHGNEMSIKTKRDCGFAFLWILRHDEHGRRKDCLEKLSLPEPAAAAAMNALLILFIIYQEKDGKNENQFGVREVGGDC